MTTIEPHPVLPPAHYTLLVRPRHGSAPIVLRLRSFTLEERIHAPYELSIIAVLDREANPDVLLDAHVELGIHRGEALRIVYGLVLAVNVTGEPGGALTVHLQVGPALARLGLQPKSRIFQGASVVDVVRAVLEQPLLTSGSRLDLSRLRWSYEPRDYYVQRGETDLAFVLRILAEAHITLLLHHADGHESVVLIDRNEALPLHDGEPFDRHENAKIPWLPIVPHQAHHNPVESIRLRMLQTHGADVELRAASNATTLCAGSVFELVDPPSEDHDETWLVTRIRHVGLVSIADEADYDNELECQPWRLPLTPARPVRRPPDDTQTAVVVGRVGEPGTLDEEGRLCVQMRWNEPDHGLGYATCHLPVAERLLRDVPRPGAEIIVSFIDGDPDRPMCTGVVLESSQER